MKTASLSVIPLWNILKKQEDKQEGIHIRPDMIRKAIEVEAKRSSEEQRKQFEREFASMSLLDVFSSGQISRTRREVIRELIQTGAEEEMIKSIIRPELTEAEVQEKKRAWMIASRILTR